MLITRRQALSNSTFALGGAVLAPRLANAETAASKSAIEADPAQPVNLVIVVGRVSAHNHRPPRPAHETELRQTSPLKDEVNCRTDILHSHISRNDRRIVGGWLCDPAVRPPD